MQDIEYFLGLKKTGNRQVDRMNDLNNRVVTAVFDLGYSSVDDPKLVKKVAKKLNVPEKDVRSSIYRIREEGGLATILQYLPRDKRATRFVVEDLERFTYKKD